jgi:hypothetical protein
LTQRFSGSTAHGSAAEDRSLKRSLMQTAAQNYHSIHLHTLGQIRGSDKQLKRKHSLCQQGNDSLTDYNGQCDVRLYNPKCSEDLRKTTAKYEAGKYLYFSTRSILLGSMMWFVVGLPARMWDMEEYLILTGQCPGLGHRQWPQDS